MAKATSKAAVKETPKAPVASENEQAGAEEQEEKEDSVQSSIKPKKRHPGPWVKMTEKQVAEHTEAGTLFGYDPKTGEGIIKK